MQWKKSVVVIVVKEEDVFGLGLPNHFDKSHANVFSSGLCIRLACVDKEINIFFGKAEAMNDDALHPHNVVHTSVKFIFCVGIMTLRDALIFYPQNQQFLCIASHRNNIFFFVLSFHLICIFESIHLFFVLSFPLIHVQSLD
jgi:hypothetical protein